MTSRHPNPTWQYGPAALYTGDARQVLASLPDASADAIVTSPPYFGLRDYGTGAWTGGRDPDCTHPGTRRRARQTSACLSCGAVWTDQQYGLEPTLDAYVTNLTAVFAEARRVLSADGTLWVNLGDCYATGGTGRADATRLYPSMAGSQRSRRDRRTGQATSLPAKNLLGVPWRVAFALQADGWILRQAIVWHKPNAMPESVTDRPAASHEYLFLFSRSSRYWFDLDPIRESHKTATPTTSPIGGTRQRVGLLGSARRTAPGGSKYDAGPDVFNGRRHGLYMRPGRPHERAHPHGRNPGSVWSISTRPNREAHFATFPIDLPLRCIASGCKPGGTVLDPFSGAATTGLAALQLGRRYIGVELNADYNALGSRRLRQTLADSDDAAPPSAA